jgi:hypothetical protein
MEEGQDLLKLIQNLKAVGHTGVAIMTNFASRQLQLLMERSHPAYEYASEDFNTTRLVP